VFEVDIFGVIFHAKTVRYRLTCELQQRSLARQRASFAAGVCARSACAFAAAEA
jgi:hypothetical protein